MDRLERRLVNGLGGIITNVTTLASEAVRQCFEVGRLLSIRQTINAGAWPESKTSQTVGLSRNATTTIPLQLSRA